MGERTPRKLMSSWYQVEAGDQEESECPVERLLPRLGINLGSPESSKSSLATAQPLSRPLPYFLQQDRPLNLELTASATSVSQQAPRTTQLCPLCLAYGVLHHSCHLFFMWVLGSKLRS